MIAVTTRKFDLVLYGATGFVGRRAATYLAQRSARRKLRWAIAGRDARKLAALGQELAADPAAVTSPEIIVADCHDAAAVAALAASARIVLSTAGPYALYGDTIVDACVGQRTHYADITGETSWVRRVIDRHHERAAREGTRIVPFCGFDSVPSDLGTLLLVRHIEKAFGAPCVAVKAYFRMMGGFNGGTLATNALRFETRDVETGRNPFLLNPPGRHSASERQNNEDPRGARYDTAIGAWVAPFVMGPINTRVVRRSAALNAAYRTPYGPRFRYQEYTKFGPPFAAGEGHGTGCSDAGVRAGHGTRSSAPAAGQGPAAAGRRTVRGVDGDRLVQDRSPRLHRRRAHRAGAHRLRRRPGQPRDAAHPLRGRPRTGIRWTQAARRPGRGGVLTPATALGEALVPRLRAAGFEISVGD